MSTLPPLGRRVRFGRVDVPPREDPVYAQWLPEPGRLQDADGETVDPLTEAIYTTPGDLGADELGVRFSLISTVMLSRLDYFGVGFDNYDWALGLGSGTVLAGDVPLAEARETLTGTVYERSGSLLDFDLYRRPDVGHVVALSGTHVVFGRGEQARSTVETLVETGRGRTPRAVDTDDRAGRFVRTVGSSPWTWYGAKLFGFGGQEAALQTRPVASAHSLSFDETAAYLVANSLFPAGRVPSKSRMKDVLETRSRVLESSGADVTITDRLVTVELRVDESTLENDDVGLDLPQVTWSSRLDASATALGITHHAGEPVDASRLSTKFDPNSGNDRLEPATGTINPGDTITVDVSGRQTDRFTLVYTVPDGDTSAVVYETSLPAEDSRGEATRNGDS